MATFKSLRKIGECMKRYRINVDCQKKMPVAKEPIDASFDVKGSFIGLSRELGLRSLVDESNTLDKIKILTKVIAELDKEETGLFNYQYFIDADKESPDLEMLESFKKKFPTLDFALDSTHNIFATLMRDYLRKACFRFFSYYKMGYFVRFELINQ